MQGGRIDSTTGKDRQMKNKLAVVGLIVATCCLAAASVSVWGMGKMKDKEPAAPAAPAMAADQPQAAMTHYLCPKCHVMSDMAGKCPKCEAEMVPTHILAVKGGTAYCCGCGGDCKCKGATDDTAKCSCGKEVMKVDVKGKYVCACPDPGKCCTSVSDKPGKCQCNKDMIKAE